VQQISNNNIKRIRSLQLKKFRDELELFVVEGYKMVDEAISSCPDAIQILVCSEENARFNLPENRCFYLAPQALKKLGSQSSGTKILAVIKKKKHVFPSQLDGWMIALDGIQDPGNLGTIIRTADWFGIKDIVCSEDTADVFNSKCLQASMGSVFRVRVHTTSLATWLQPFAPQTFAAVLDGTDIFSVKKQPEGILVLGSEGQGIRHDVQEIITQKVRIPGHSKCESLNVAVSAGILMQHFCV
jgi:TrmH family RNA methyltransferase